MAIKDIPDCNVLISVIWDANHEIIKDKFVILNQANPVPELYIIDGDETRLDHIKTVVYDVTTSLVTKYPKHVSLSKSPRRPNFNRDKLIDQLSNYILENGLYDIDQQTLLSAILELNELYSKAPPVNKISPKIMNKCRLLSFS